MKIHESSFARSSMSALVRAASFMGALGLAAAACGAGGQARSASAAKAPTTEANITRLTSSILGSSQFAHHPLDAELAGKFLDAYFDDLDANRTLFLQSDVAELAKYRKTLADATRSTGDTSAAHAIFARYVARLEQREKFVAELLKNTRFEFTGHDSYEADRSHAPRPASLSEAKRLWKTQLRAEYLDEKLVDEKKGSIAATLAHRYASVLRTMKTLKPAEVSEIYLNALAHVYDPHSDYLGHEQMENLSISMNLSLFGIGASLRSVDGQCKVVDLVPGGPAAREGSLKPEDRILAVAQPGQPPVEVTDMPLSRVVDLIRGPKGSSVTLTVIPGGVRGSAPPEKVSLVREKVELEDAQASAQIIDLGEGKPSFRVGVLNVPAFYADMRPHAGLGRSVTRDVAKLLGKLEAEKVAGVVLDLRNNGGGSLSEAVSLTGLFIKQGPVVQTRGPAGDVEVDVDPDPSQLYAGPLVVLSNRLSASASEIVSGALQDYGRAVVVGDSATFGKGTVQSILPLAPIMDENKLSHEYDPGALKITIRKFYRPSGPSTQLRGVASDIVVPSGTDLDRLSETAMKGPLPWDSLTPARYEHLDRVTPFVPRLREASQRRVAADPVFASIAESSAELRARLARKLVSLNEAERRQELTAIKARQEQVEQALELRRAKPQVYKITLKNAGSPGLPAPEPAPVAHAKPLQPSSATVSKRSAPSVDPILGEAEQVLRDYVGLLRRDG